MLLSCWKSLPSIVTTVGRAAETVGRSNDFWRKFSLSLLVQIRDCQDAGSVNGFYFGDVVL